MKISAPYFLINQEFWNIQFPRKKHWVNPNCQNSEPTKRTVSILAKMILLRGFQKNLAAKYFQYKI